MVVNEGHGTVIIPCFKVPLGAWWVVQPGRFESATGLSVGMRLERSVRSSAR